MTKLIYVIFPFLSLSIFAQYKPNEHISGFNLTSITYRHNKNWSAFMEIQERAIEDYSVPDYYEVKGGVGYYLYKNHQLLLGVGHYRTYKNSDFYQKEFRAWLQYIFTMKIDRLKLDHRIRLEKRFFEKIQSGEQTQDERYRYRLTANWPLMKKSDGSDCCLSMLSRRYFSHPMFRISREIEFSADLDIILIQ